MTATPVIRAPAKQVIFEIDRGMTWSFFYRVTDAGVPRDLTGYICRHKFYDKQGGTLLLNASQYFINGLTAGSVNVKVPDEVTAGLNWDKGFGVHELESPAGDVVLRFYGPVVVVGASIV